ncbi:MAG: 4a-hydroxytetrahydrobiopterin dehydratase [Cyanobacteria bacterium P01_F01_bin.116]
MFLLVLSLNPDIGFEPVMMEAPIVTQRWSVVSTKGLPTRLSESEVSLRMQSLPDWTTDGESLFYLRTFENFVEAIDFINSLVEPSEVLTHHPDITINYNRVSLKLTTHDAGGLTDLDFQLATTISQL